MKNGVFGGVFLGGKVCFWRKNKEKCRPNAHVVRKRGYKRIQSGYELIKVAIKVVCFWDKVGTK